MLTLIHKSMISGYWEECNGKNYHFFLQVVNKQSVSVDTPIIGTVVGIFDEGYSCNGRIPCNIPASIDLKETNENIVAFILSCNKIVN